MGTSSSVERVRRSRDKFRKLSPIFSLELFLHFSFLTFIITINYQAYVLILSEGLLFAFLSLTSRLTEKLIEPGNQSTARLKF